MVGEALAGLSALKTAFDIAKGLKDISDATVRNAAVIELQEKILSAQQTQSALSEKVGDLEKEVVRLKAWGAEKQRYELQGVAPGAFAYPVKESMRGTEPMHWLCANCYQQDKKRILQSHRGDASYIYHRCPECQGEIRIPKPQGTGQSIARQLPR